MAKSTLPQRLIRDVERTLQGRINDVKNKIAEHYAQCRAELGGVAETFGIEKDELFTLAGVPVPEEKRRKKAVKKKTVVKKKAVAPKKAKKKAIKKGVAKKIAVKKATKKPSGGTAEEKVAAFLKKNPTASGSAISKATGYSDKTVYNTKAWQKRRRAK
jgi:hypothetical protein